MNGQPEIHRLHALVPPNVPEHAVLRCIGSGSYGEVWIARHARGDYRAVKFVSRQMFQRDRPFEREFTGMLKYEPVSRSHEGLVDVLQVGRDNETGVFFYVMELGDDAFLGREIQPERYVPKTLRSEIDQRNRLAFDECLRIALSLTSALGHLHQHGLIHRDVKPSNVIFVNGQPKLADIGLVADVNEARSYVGTEGFIPPEGPGTAQADLFSLGKTVYEMATGKDRKEFPALPTDLAHSPDHARLLELNEVIVKACATDPAQRYQTSAEMLADLALLQSGRSVRHARALERRLQTAKKVGLFAMAAAVVAAGAYLVAQLDARRARDAEKMANQHLAKAYVAQARAGRMSGIQGQRVESLRAVAAAAKLQPSVELRNEAVGALALFDVEDWYWQERASFTENLAFDHAMERYALGNRQGEITVYRLPEDTELMRLTGSRSATRYLQFSPDGRFLAANFMSTRLVIWNLVSGTQVVNSKFGELVWGATCVFPPDGRTVGVRTAEPRIAFFDLSTGAEIESLKLNVPATSFALRPDGRVLAVAAGTEVELWDVASRTLQSRLPYPPSVVGLQWHPEGRRLAVGGREGKLCLWDTQTTNRLELEGHQGSVPSMVFNHRGDVLVSYAWDGTTRFWDVATGQQLLLSYGTAALGFSTDDGRLAYSKEGTGFGVWRVHRSTIFRKLAPPIGSSKRIGTVDLSADGRWLIAPNPEGVHIWDFGSGRLVQFQPANDTHSALFAADGKSMVAASSRQLWQWPLLEPEEDDEPGFVFGPAKRWATFPGSFFPNTTVTGAKRERMTVHGRTGIWMAQLGELIPTRVLDGNGIGNTAAISPDGKWLATTQWKDGGTKVWDAGRREVVRELGEQGGYVTFSPDGRWLVVGSGASYDFYETGSWRQHHVIRRDSAGAGLGQVAFSRDGRLLALALSRRIVQLVEADSGREIVLLAPPSPQSVGWLAFSPDDQNLMAATDQAEIQVWDLRALRRELAALNLNWAD